MLGQSGHGAQSAADREGKSPASAWSKWSLALIGNASAHKFGTKTCGPSRGIFDKETRRKPLAFAAYAAAMAILGCFGTRQRAGIAGGLLE